MLHFREKNSTGAPYAPHMPAWRRQVLATDAGAIDILDNGKRAAPAVILITHGLGSLESFKSLAESLDHRFPGRRILAFSRPGRGQSPEPAGIVPEQRLSHEAFDVLPALMRALDVPSADLIAHGDGVAVAMLFASAHPWMVDRMVAISPQVHAEHRELAARAEWLADLDCSRDIERLGAEHADRDMAVRSWLAGRQALAADPHLVLTHISTLAAPLLLIQGLRDAQGAQHQMDAISSRIQGPMQWVMLKRDGQYPQLDNTEVVLDLIARHIKEPMPPAARHDLGLRVGE